MKALPDIRTANKVVELILKNASIAVTGIWQAEDDGVLNPANIKLVPGTIIPKAVGSAGLTPLEAPGRSAVPLRACRDTGLTLASFPAVYPFTIKVYWRWTGCRDEGVATTYWLWITGSEIWAQKILGAPGVAQCVVRHSSPPSGNRASAMSATGARKRYSSIRTVPSAPYN